MARVDRWCLAAAAAALLTLPAEAGVVGIDARNGVGPHNLGIGSHYDDFRATVAGQGHTLSILTSFTAADIHGLDALILLQPFSLGGILTTTELADVQAFVTGGGGLFVIGEGGLSTPSTVSNTNVLLGPFGLALSSLQVNPTGTVVGGLVAHPVTEGVGTFALDFHRPLSMFSGGAIDLTSGSGDEDALGVSDGAGGAGNVVVVSDSNMWADDEAVADANLSSAGNQRLLENIVDHIAGGDCNGNGVDDDVELASGASADCNANLVPDECDIASGASLDLNLDGVPDECGPLSGTPDEISLAAGGSQDLLIDAGPASAGDFFFVVGTTSGVSPGFAFQDLHVPLNPDAYFGATLAGPNTPPLVTSLGTLDAGGAATARFVMPPGSPPSFAGLTVHHACAVIDSAPIPGLVLVSNPVAIDLLP